MLTRRLTGPWLWIATAVAGLVVGVGLASPMIMTAGPVAVLFSAREFRRRLVRVSARRSEDGLQMAVDHLIQQLRAGLSLRQSCERLDDCWSGGEVAAVAPLVAELRSGAALMDAARSLDEQDQSVQLLSVTLQVLAANGGPAVPGLQRLRHTLIAAAQARQQAYAQAGQALASAAMLVAAPAVFGLAVAILDHNAARLYLFEPLGTVCVLTALVMSYLGWSWIQRVLVSALAATA